MKELSLLRFSWVISCFAVLCSYVYEYYFGVEPCYMCLQQRYLMIGLCSFLFPLWSHLPLFQILSAGCASVGMNIAMDQVILQETPFDTIPSLIVQLPDSLEGFTVFFTLPIAAFVTFSAVFLMILCNTIRSKN